LPHTQDAANYAAFVYAVDLLFDHGGFQAQGYPNAVEKFGAWAHYNTTANDHEGAKQPPSRRDVGNLNAQSVWPQDPQFPGSTLPAPQRFMVQAYLLAAQSFMNLCDDLHTLARSVEDAATLAAFEAVLEETKNFIKEDSSGHPLHFTKPTLLALAERMGAAAVSVQAPAEITGDEFSVHIGFA
jgi:hypothetical protein